LYFPKDAQVATMATGERCDDDDDGNSGRRKHVQTHKYRGQIGKGPGGTREKRRGKLGAKAMGTGGKASSGFRGFQFLTLANKRAKNAAKKKN